MHVWHVLASDAAAVAPTVVLATVTAAVISTTLVRYLPGLRAPNPPPAEWPWQAHGDRLTRIETRLDGSLQEIDRRLANIEKKLDER